MITKKMQCPKCGQIFTSSGNPGDTITMQCPSCNLTGRVMFEKTFSPDISNENTAIEVDNLRKEYGSLVAVNNISFSVKKGEVFAFLGPNGAGKTTTVEMIESIRQPTAGTIKILGKDIRKSFNQVKEYISILPQEFHSFERLTVRETLVYFSAFYKKRANIDDIINILDFKEHEKKLYKDLSGGLKQRVGVAIALVNDPEIIFLDEPTTGLDPKARREVWNVIEGLRDKGKTIFLTTHYMEEAEHLADHIAIIHKGKIIAEGSLDKLIEKYGKGSILDIKNCTDKDAIKLLNEKGFKAYPEGNGDISVKIDNKERVLEVLSYLRHDCIDYESIGIRGSNLEEVFLNMTGAKLKEEEQ